MCGYVLIQLYQWTLKFEFNITFMGHEIAFFFGLFLWFFRWSCMDVRVGLYRKLSTEELMLLNCGVGEDS